MAEKKKEAVVVIVGEKPAKKAPAKKAPAKETAVKDAPVKKEATTTTAKKAPAKTAEKAAPVKKEAPVVEKEVKVEVAATETVAEVKPVVEAAPVKKAPAKKAAKAKAPLYIDGRYVVEKQLPAKPAKGSKPYADAKKSVKVTLVKSTAGCLKKQQATVKALGLTKIRSSNILPDNAATRGMIFRVQHLVVVEEVK